MSERDDDEVYEAVRADFDDSLPPEVRRSIPAVEWGVRLGQYIRRVAGGTNRRRAYHVRQAINEMPTTQRSWFIHMLRSRHIERERLTERHRVLTEQVREQTRRVVELETEVAMMRASLTGTASFVDAAAKAAEMRNGRTA